MKKVYLLTLVVILFFPLAASAEILKAACLYEKYETAGATSRFEGAKCGFVDYDGTWKVQPKYDQVKEYSDGLAAYKIDDLWGFLDETGKEKIPAQFSVVSSFREGLVYVTRKDMSGWIIIDKDGKRIGDNQFSNPSTFNEGLSENRYVNGSKWGFVGRNGEFKIKPQYRYANSFSTGLAAVEKVGVFSNYSIFIDKDGQQALDETFEKAWFFHHNGLAAVKKDGKYRLFTRAGSFLGGEFDNISLQYLNSDGLIPFNLRDAAGEVRCGYINKQAKIVIEPDYLPPCQGFNGGYARVKTPAKPNYSTFIDKTGKTVIDGETYITFWDFHGKMARFRIGSGYGIIDRSGHAGAIANNLLAIDERAINGLRTFVNKAGRTGLLRDDKKVIVLSDEH